MERINEILNILSDDIFASEIDFQYSEMIDELMAEYNSQMYASNSYDMDAAYYGETI